jgi:Tfp pilus assembly protein PilF
MWCLYEIFINALYNGAFEVIIPRSHMRSFVEDVFVDIDIIYRKLCSIDVKQSSTSVPTDRDAIMIEIDVDDGIKQFNALVRKTMQKWVAKVAIDNCIERMPSINSHTPDMIVSNANKVAYLLSEYQHFPQAKILFEATLRLYDMQYGPLHPNALGIANNLVFTLFRLSLKQEAEAMVIRVIDGYSRAMGDDHDNTMAALITGANIFTNHSKYAEAEQYYRRVLKQLEVRRGPKHPSTLDAVKNIAYLLSCQKKFAESERYYQRALDGYMARFGPNHKLTCDIANNYGVLMVERGSLAKATTLLKTAYCGFSATLGPEHEVTVASKQKMIHCSIKSHGVDRAISHLHVSKACVIS